MNDCESFLDILSECNCCERHKIDKPKKNPFMRILFVFKR